MGILNWIFGPRPKPVTPPTPVPTPPSDIVAAVNTLRTRVGLQPLADNPVLQGTSSGWAASMAASGRMTHGDFAGRMRAAGVGRAGECIGYGYQDAAAMAAAWYTDPAHHAIIMDHAMTGAGGAVAMTPNGTPYWCLDTSS